MFFFVFYNHIEISIDDIDREQYACSRANGSHEVCENGKHSDTDASHAGGDRNVLVQDRNLSVQLNYHGGVPVAHQLHVLVAQLLRNVSRTFTRYFDPQFGEEGAGTQNEQNVDHHMDWVDQNVAEVTGR